MRKLRFKNKLLVTGASGLLGRRICREATQLYDVHGISFKNDIVIPKATIRKADLTSFEETAKLFKNIRPAAVIHTAAASNPNYCQIHNQVARKINIGVTVNLAKLCAEDNIPFVFTSSDLVFNGRAAPYNENDPASPISVYGEHKAEAENGVLAAWPEAAVARMPLLYDSDSSVSRNFYPQMVQAMQTGQKLHLFTDEHRTPLSVRTGALALLKVVGNISGLIHLGGPERISRYDFGRLIASVMQLSPAQLIPCLRSDVPMAAPRPRDVSLDSAKARALISFNPPPLAEEIRRSLMI